MLTWWLFWGSFATLLYIYIGFPILLSLRGLLCSLPVRHGCETPMVSIIIAAYNEAEVIADKLDNTFALDYPCDCLEVIVASDGSDDGTEERVAVYPAGNVHLLSLPRRGKNATLNEAVSVARGDIFIFTDADSMLTPDALQHLIAPFSDETVGGVGGNFHYTAQQQEGSGERTYWRFDRLLKDLQHRAGGLVHESARRS